MQMIFNILLRLNKLPYIKFIFNLYFSLQIKIMELDIINDILNSTVKGLF